MFALGRVLPELLYTGIQLTMYFEADMPKPKILRTSRWHSEIFDLKLAGRMPHF